MNRSTRLDYYILEGVRPNQRPKLRHGLANLQHAWGNALTALLQALTPNDEPIVTHHRDRQGNPYYRMYDPVTRQRTTCSSEAEVRQWLEQRYRG
ncbi:MAG: hypothetical protein AAF289_09515 [Cyanobacteria bacterium P01_A01_bin.135]